MTNLKCWRVEGQGDLCGAVAIVIARDAVEAIHLARQITDRGWLVCFDTTEELPALTPAVTVPMVVTAYFMGE